MAPRLRVNGILGKQNGGAAAISAKQLGMILNNILTQFEDASEDLMVEALEPTFEKAKMYTPKRTHTLVNSGYLVKGSFRGRPRVEIGFGRGGMPYYTAYVHEMTGIKHADPTRAKFLESAVMEDLPLIYGRLGDSYRRFMNG